MSATRPRTALGGVALLLALTGTAYAVGTTMGSSPARADVTLPAFDDCDALTERMQSLALPYVNAYGIGQVVEEDMPMRGPMRQSSGDDAVAATAEEAAPPMPMAAGEAKAAAPSGTDGFSANSSGVDSDAGSDAANAVGPGRTGTNLQEAGVDEPDIAKTDGDFVYALDGGTLRITDVSGSSPRERGSLSLSNRGVSPTEMLLAGDRALVLGTASSYTTRGFSGRDFDNGADIYRGDEEMPGYNTAVLALVDLSDRDNPRVISTEEITGRQVSARMTGRTARVVLSSTPELSFRRPSGYADDSILQYNKDVVRRASASDWLPSRTIIDGSGRISSPAAPLVECSDVRYPSEDSGLDMLSVLTLDLGGDDALQSATSTAVVTAGDLVYASPEKLYVATTQGGWGRGGSSRFDTDMRRADGNLTSVHEFDITDPARTAYRSSGAVAGYIPGRWAMSEYAGNLRVVTTTRQPWLYDGSGGGGDTVSNIVVLRPRRDRLVQVGSVSGMGKGETVRAVRWFDELAAVVTFRQTDPLYLVDMSVPENPVVRGELKVPGYSAYLHPIGDHRLLGVGQDADQRGSEQGLQVSSFDIADADSPRETDKVTYGNGSSSPVQTDARGFVYLPDRRTAVLPASYPIGGYATPRPFCPPNAMCPEFAPEYRFESGLISVKVDKDGRLTKAGSWGDQTRDASGRYAEGNVAKVLALPGGRLAALTDTGLAVLDADDLTSSGYVRYKA